MPTADHGWPRGTALFELDAVDSTNAEALRLAAAGERGPLWTRADRQTGGKGRSGRSWTSEPGNLYASLLVTLPCPPATVAQLSLLAGVAAFDAIAEAAGGALPGLRLKWPNDVMVGDGTGSPPPLAGGEARGKGIFFTVAKLGGILLESVAASGGTTVVIGTGINIRHAPAGLGRPVAHLVALGVDVTPRALLDALARATDRWLAAWQHGTGFAQVREAWLARAHPLGESLTIATGAGTTAGTFAGLDTDGALLMHVMDGTGNGPTCVRRFTFGDVAVGSAPPTPLTTKTGC